jgi:hypothetical protein
MYSRDSPRYSYARKTKKRISWHASIKVCSSLTAETQRELTKKILATKDFSAVRANHLKTMNETNRRLNVGKQLDQWEVQDLVDVNKIGVLFVYNSSD